MNESSRPNENDKQRGPSPIRGLARVAHAGLKVGDLIAAKLESQVIDKPREEPATKKAE